MDKNLKKKDAPNENSYTGFLKKRAPIYLGLTGLFLVFVVAGLMENDLTSLYPEDLTDQEKQVLDMIMSYNGPNEKGLTVLEALDTKIKERYSDKVYDDRSTKVLINVTAIDSKNTELAFTFESDKKEITYIWSVNVESNEIKSQNQYAKGIMDFVKFYD